MESHIVIWIEKIKNLLRCITVKKYCFEVRGIRYSEIDRGVPWILKFVEIWVDGSSSI